ncbi:4-hydroxybenzoate 3-monooxygenase [Rhodobacteraceae bacterium CCMM004]|nr:4-hydroxybenzoate 3-monooxygenase [Rhodobacteraceae bacterium CCMM004]
MRTQVCIIGGGPSGLLLGHLLHLAGLDTLILERQSRAYVLSRIRAGVLEQGAVETLARAGAATRLEAQGFRHAGIELAAQNRSFRVDFRDLIDRDVVVYGQTEVTTDLYDARDRSGAPVLHGVEDVTLHDIDTDCPHVAFRHDGAHRSVACDWIVGADGFHGPSRQAIPRSVLRTYERIYPFGWLGVLSETPPAGPELIYANHPRGFALCSMRNEGLSRYYIQTAADEDPEAWTDEAFWDELRRRIPEPVAETMQIGPSIEKSVAPLRSFVAEPMRWGRLCLVGDAAHIVPPTGAKGLNLAVGDVHYLEEALRRAYDGDPSGVDGYSDRALARVWQATRFSWWLTMTLHRFPGASDFDQRMQEADLAYLETSRTAQRALAENYVGLPY